MHTQTKQVGWFACLLAYAKDSRSKLIGSVALSIISVVIGLLPYYCMFRLIAAFVDKELSAELIVSWCGLALLAYGIKVVLFGLSTGLSHYAAYHILENLRLQVANRFLHAPLGEVEAHSIGEIKNVMELLAKTGTLYLNVSMKILFISMVFIKMVMSIIHLILCQEELMNLNYITI